jgi:hypothetical protein
VAAIRVTVLVEALFWSVLFFGLIDLATIVDPGEFLPAGAVAPRRPRGGAVLGRVRLARRGRIPRGPGRRHQRRHPALGGADAVGLAIAACALLAGAWSHGRRLLDTSAALATMLLGVATVVYPDAIGAMRSPGFGFVAMAWGLVVVALARLPSAR